MPAPVHRILVDGDVDGVLDVFLYQLLVEFAIRLKVLLERTVEFEALFALEQVEVVQFQAVLEFSA